MRVNDDLSKPVIVHAGKLVWVHIPAPGVDRRMLFRVGGEVARATSIVRYDPGSAFQRHVRTGGEEIIVLDGTFQDEHGDYPTGSYFCNPPGASHVPAAKDGCMIFVRLWQYREGDQAQVVRQPGQGERMEPRAGASALTVLFNDGREEVRLEGWMAGRTVTVANTRGLEFVILSGELTVHHEMLDPQSWGRLPAGTDLTVAVRSNCDCPLQKRADLVERSAAAPSGRPPDARIGGSNAAGLLEAGCGRDASALTQVPGRLKAA